MRVVSGLVMLALLGSFAPVRLYRPLPVPAQAWVRAVPLPAEALTGCVFEKVRVETGWVLTSNHPRFGGLSGLHVERGRVTTITDAGEVARFDLNGTRAVPLAMIPLEDLSRAKKSRDSESLAIAGGSAWVGFEHSNSIRRYRLPGWSLDGEMRPPDMRRWPRKGGPEAMTRLRDGRFLVLAEGSDEALLFDRDPMAGGRARKLAYAVPLGFKPVDVAELGDGRLLVLNRRYTILEGPVGFSAMLSIASLPDTGEVIAGREVARFASPCIRENFEGVSVKHDNGRETVWLASDDNFGPLQRTLILKLALQL